MGLTHVSRKSHTFLAYAEHIQAAIEKDGVVIASNGKKKVIISEVQDHLDVPEYPITDKNGVLHFIHIKTQIDRETSIGTQWDLIGRHMSKVFRAYT